jgi:hypothetical protein
LHAPEGNPASDYTDLFFYPRYDLISCDLLPYNKLTIHCTDLATTLICEAYDSGGRGESGAFQGGFRALSHIYRPLTARGLPTLSTFFLPN